MDHEPNDADRAPVQAGYASEPRYLDHRKSGQDQPYAPYFRAVAQPIREHIVNALVGGLAPTEYGYGVDEVADATTRARRQTSAPAGTPPHRIAHPSASPSTSEPQKRP